MKRIFSAYCSKRTKTQCSDLTKPLYDQKYFKLQATAKKIPKKQKKKQKQKQKKNENTFITRSR